VAPADGLDDGRHDAEVAIRHHLGHSERLVWAGRPRQGIVVRAADAFMIPFSLMWGGFMFFWVHSAVAEGAPWPFVLSGTLFLLMGVHFVFGRFVLDAWLRKKTYYALSNERIIIVSGLLTRRIKSLSLRTLTDVTLDQRADGTGTITFGPVRPMAWWGQGMAYPGMWVQVPPSFELIPRAKEVYDLIQDAQQASS
jgi:hypothetical protein